MIVGRHSILDSLLEGVLADGAAQIAIPELYTLIHIADTCLCRVERLHQAEMVAHVGSPVVTAAGHSLAATQ